MLEYSEYYDEHIYRSIFGESQTPPEINENLENNKYFFLVCRLIYAVEDTVSFLFGIIKLYFSLVASYFERSDAEAPDDLHNALQSLPDLLIIISIAIPLTIIQVLGAYFIDSKDLKTNFYKRLFAKIIAPYLRDILQGIKWAYKGMRSMLNMIFYFMPRDQALIIKILLPLSIGIALISLINRIFLRTLRNLRKDKQSTNRKLSIETLEEGYVLKFRQELPKEKKELNKLKKSLIYVENGADLKIYYVNKDSNSTELSIEDEIKQNLKQKIQKFQKENIQNRIKAKLNPTKLHFFETLPEDLNNFRNSLIYLANGTLYKINNDGTTTLDRRSEYIKKLMKYEIDYKTTLVLYSHQVKELVKEINCDYELGINYEEWQEAQNKKAAETLRPWLTTVCYGSVILSALIDGTYFYIGTLFLASFNPAGFIAMMVMGITMVMICLIGRIYEEYSYQKSFKISQIEVELSKEKTKANIISQEIEKLLKSVENTDKIKQLLLDFEKALNNYDAAQKLLKKLHTISALEAFLRGLKNGLSSQGVISALMFTGVVIMSLSGIACPPIFIYVMMSISFLFLIRSVYRYMRSYYAYKETDKDFEEIPKNQEPITKEAQFSAEHPDLNYLKEQHEKLCNKKEFLETRFINKAPTSMKKNIMRHGAYFSLDLLRIGEILPNVRQAHRNTSKSGG